MAVASYTYEALPAAVRQDLPDADRLTTAAGTLTSAISTTITITIGPAAKLGFTTSPTDSQVNTTFAVQPVAAIQDAGGNTITTSTAPVTLKITAPTGGANLNCTTNPKTAVAGVSTFAGCKITKTGTRTLTATSPPASARASTSPAARPPNSPSPPAPRAAPAASPSARNPW